jgi:transcriptional regulator with XRE-family HTH domain
MDRSSELLAFGRTLRRIRRERDLSQEALAARAGFHPNHISDIERANKDPRLTTVLQLARALDLSPEDLIGALTRALAETSDTSS